MSLVLIVSKTKMHEGRVCVGGIDLENHVSVRLHDEDGYHETEESCEYEVRDVWNIDYEYNSTRPMPHCNEDVNVMMKLKKGVLRDDYSMLDILNSFNFNYYEGGIQNIFSGMMMTNDNGKMYISFPNVPDHSTCFWICDKPLRRKIFTRPNNKQKILYSYPSIGFRYGIDIPYVGLEQHIERIPAGTLIRLSLAHWWSPKDKPDEEERCYLQLSGWY